MSLVANFCALLTELIADMSRVYPEEADIVTFGEFVAQARKTNPRLLVTAFDECVRIPYGGKILEGDIEFFLNKDYKKDIGGAASTDMVGKIEGFKASVRRLRPTDIQAVTRYMQGLVKLSEAFAAGDKNTARTT